MSDTPDLAEDLFPVINSREVHAMARACPSTWMLDGLVSESVSLWYGPSEIGKSRFVVGFIAAMLRGEEFLGRRPAVPIQRITVLTADAGGEREYGRRLCLDDGLWAGLTEAETPGLNIIPIPTMTGPGMWAMLRGVLDRLDPQLVIMDPLSNVINGDPNLAGPVAEVFRGVRALGRPTVIVAHASSKPTQYGRRRGSQTPLGHSSIVGSSRWRVEMLADRSGVLGRLLCTGNDGPQREITLTRGERLTDFTVAEEKTAEVIELESKRAGDATESAERQAAAWLVATHPEVTSQAVASRLLAEEYPGLATGTDKPRAIARSLSRRAGVGRLLVINEHGTQLAPGVLLAV